MKLMIYTQYMENYGVDEAPYWKAKGGSEYFVRLSPTDRWQDKLVAALQTVTTLDQPGYREWPVSWAVEEDDFKTEFERNQEEYGDTHICRPQEVFVL